MAKNLLTHNFLLASLLVLTAATSNALEIQHITDGMPAIHMLRSMLGSSGELARHGVPCDSWRLGVEAHNVIDWTSIPANCVNYVGHYMLGGQYRCDSALVVDEAIKYVESIELAGNGTKVWVFDIDETSLSNLPYYARHGFGVEAYNSTLLNQWVLEAAAPALPESMRLYKKLLSLGIKVVFLTGRHESQRNATAANLKKVGYLKWEKLLLRSEGDNTSAVSYKSGERQKLLDAGFVIVGNIGDQWSDILGQPEGDRTFKLPDPMYYVG